VRRHIFDHLDRSQVDAMAGIFTAVQRALRESCPSATHE
jgi:hypothetical protein